MSNDSEKHEVVESQPSRKKPLWQFYNLVTQYEYTDEVEAREIFDQTMGDFENYTASPDLWHNTAMVAGRVDHYDAQAKLIQEGLREWPDKVDLLCDELQQCITHHYDEKRAAEIWEQLDSMPRQKTGSYWRFWVYGALYLSRVLSKRQEALDLLDAGLRSVRRDALMDIIRSYRSILIDSAPEESLKTTEEVERFQEDALNRLEERYRLGIRLGVENGHVLAIQLAQLSRERAGQGLVQDDSSDEAKQARERASQSPVQDDSSDGDRQTREHLEQALEYLDLAESLYTGIGGENHPVWEIYQERARVLMAMNEYEEALYLLRSLPKSRQNEMSLSAMMKFAAFKTGMDLEAKSVPGASAESDVTTFSPEEALDQAIQILFANNGRLLSELARDNAMIRRVLDQVMHQLQSEQQR